MDLRQGSLHKCYQSKPKSKRCNLAGCFSLRSMLMSHLHKRGLLLGIIRACEPALHRVGPGGTPLSMQIQKHHSASFFVPQSLPGTALMHLGYDVQRLQQHEMQCRLSRGTWTEFALC